MAQKKAKQTVRQRSQAGQPQAKKRRIRQHAKGVASPVKRFFSKLGKLLSPLGFVLIPFKTKPARMVGRFLAKVLLINYIVSSWRELRGVTWPNLRETVRLTIAVFLFSIVFGVLIAVTDYGLDKVFKKILLR